MFKKFLIVLGLTCGGFITVYAQETVNVVNHGPQVFASSIQGSTFSQAVNGKQYVYTVVRGMPAKMVGYDLSTQQKIVEIPLSGTDGSWDMVTGSDNTIYATGNGNLFQHKIGTDTVTNLGVVVPGERVLWDLIAGKDGIIYGGGYPTGSIFKYDPRTGFENLTQGALKPGELYLRSLVYSAKEHKIFAGIGARADFMELDLRNNTRRSLVDSSYQEREFFYNMGIVEDLPGGDRVFAWVNDAKRKETLVYNLSTKALEPSLPTLDAKSVIKDQHKPYVYYTALSKLYRLDYSQQRPQPQLLGAIAGETKSVAYNSAGDLMMITSAKKIFTYSIKKGTLTDFDLSVPGQPIEIQSIEPGPDHKIWSSGYLAGNHGTFDPKTGLNTPYYGVHQSENIKSLGSNLYFGVYTHAYIYRYDTSKSWDLKQGNPKNLGSIENQDRPFAMVALPEKGKMLFGTVPIYGKLGGSIADLDVKTEQFETFEQLIPNQAFVSFVTLEGRVFGGTTIFGGLGSSPTEQHAYLFEWDVEGKKIAHKIPFEGYMSVSGLFVGPDKQLWGFADGTLFSYDIKNHKMLKKFEVYSYPNRPSHIWRNGMAVLHPNGHVYFTLTNKLYKYDSIQDKVIDLNQSGALIALDPLGNVYFKRAHELWSFHPAQ